MKIICKRTEPIKSLKLNNLYTIDHIHECRCGVISYGLKEIKKFDIDKDPKLKSLCTCNKTINFPYPLFNSNRFHELSDLTFDKLLELLKNK